MALRRITPWVLGWCWAASALAQTPAAPPVAPLAAQAQLQAAASEIVFTTRQMGVPVEGRFTRFGAQLTLNPRQPETGSVNLTVDTGSARFGSPELDLEVPKAPWFDVARFPQASFRSSAIKASGTGRFDVTGKLSIKGQARDIEVPVQLQPAAGGLVRASGRFTIKRLDFTVGSGEWTDTALLADEVQVRFSLLFSGLAAP